MVRGDDLLSEGRVLAEEPVTRVDRVGAGALGGGEERLDVQVGLLHGRRPDELGPGRGLHVRRARVGFGEDGDGLDPKCAVVGHEPVCDLTAVRDEDAGDWSGSGR